MNQFRVCRKDVVVPRCTNACPAGVDVPRYIRAVRDGNYDQAVGVLREKIPFPVVCADACFAPCEEVCAYKQFGEPVAIRAIKRVAVDKGGDSWKKYKKVPVQTGKKAAVIGAGPAGLTAAYYLASKGHKVTVFDAFPKPGGMMRYGIPKYRVPENRLDRDIDDIMATGIDFRGNSVVGKDIEFLELKQTFDAVFISSGGNSSARIPLEGRNKKGVLWGWDFLRDTAMGKSAELGKKIIVIGGGNVAVDVALTVQRLGAKHIDLFCLEKREEMPAHPWEIAMAEEEGVFIHNAWAPKKIFGNESVTGIGFKRCLSVFDDSCNFDPVYDDEITHRVEADTVILAVGQEPVLDFVSRGTNIAIEGKRLVVDEDLTTAEPGVFAGGDVVTGPESIIRAIAQGRTAAKSIDVYLGGNGDISEVLAEPEDEVLLSEFAIDVKPRNDMLRLKRWQRVDNFDQIERGLNDRQAAAEARRCLSCDARRFQVVVNAEHCKECNYCMEVCGVETFHPAKNFNAKGYRPMECKSSDWCVGCLKCFFSCPDFAIDVKELRP